jgi:hypothetical protein
MSRIERSALGRAAIVLTISTLAWMTWTVVPDLVVGTIFADYLYVNQVVAVCVVLSVVERLWSKYAARASHAH